MAPLLTAAPSAFSSYLAILADYGAEPLIKTLSLLHIFPSETTTPTVLGDGRLLLARASSEKVTWYNNPVIGLLTPLIFIYCLISFFAMVFFWYQGLIDTNLNEGARATVVLTTAVAAAMATVFSAGVSPQGTRTLSGGRL
ncbi:MAG: hypothetical protein M1821_004147 [Bathelium mastoideum]|nr:MAG: hypothetical protein M1821_004147 [Bathelium mastoideum]